MKDPTIQLWAQDEVHFQRHTSLTRMWSAVGQQPRIASDSTRQKVGLFGAVNLKQGCLFTQMAPVFNAQSFGDFLCSLLQQTTGKIFLILDNARYHRARDLKEFFSNNKSRLIRVFLPPYSPELNPIERVWRITRRQITHNRYFESVQELQTALTNHFEKWKTPNHTLNVLCAKI
jgi:transposase